MIKTGIAKIIEVITKNAFLSSRLKKIVRISKMKVNPEKKTQVITRIISKMRLLIAKLTSNKNQKLMKIIIIIDKTFFFDRFFKPVMNLMILAILKLSLI